MRRISGQMHTSNGEIIWFGVIDKEPYRIVRHFKSNDKIVESTDRNKPFSWDRGEWFEIQDPNVISSVLNEVVKIKMGLADLQDSQFGFPMIWQKLHPTTGSVKVNHDTNNIRASSYDTADFNVCTSRSTSIEIEYTDEHEEFYRSYGRLR